MEVTRSSSSPFYYALLYMPSECRHSYFTEYLNTLGELEGLIETEKCDVNMLIGDFNVDFCRDGCLSRLLLDFMSELDLCACDLSFCNSIHYTYERDDGLVRSWIDHVVCILTPSLHLFLMYIVSNLALIYRIIIPLAL